MKEIKKDIYKTVTKPSIGEYKEKGSKFLAYAFEINDTDEFKSQLEKIKKEHFKARHHCYAYAIGTQHEIFRYNDDGEPSGTAGIPIYNQIKSFGLTNVGIIVVRYFGGTKLGVSGLINAYKTAAKQALLNAGTTTKYIEKQLLIKYDFKYTGVVMKAINSLGVTIISNAYTEMVETKVSMRLSYTDTFIKSIMAMILDRDIKDITGNEKIAGLKIIDIETSQ